MNEFPNVVAAISGIQDILPEDGDFMINKTDILNKYTIQKQRDVKTGIGKSSRTHDNRIG